jgi:hypothetical protein
MEQNIGFAFFTGEVRPQMPERDQKILNSLIRLHDDFEGQRKFLVLLAAETDRNYLFSQDREGNFRGSRAYRLLFKKILKQKVEARGIKVVPFDEWREKNFPLSRYPLARTGHVPHLGPLLSHGEAVFDVGAARYSEGQHSMDMHLLQIIYFGEAIDREFGEGTFLKAYRAMGRHPFTSGWVVPMERYLRLSAEGFWYFHWQWIFDLQTSSFSTVDKEFLSAFLFLR